MLQICVNLNKNTVRTTYKGGIIILGFKTKGTMKLMEQVIGREQDLEVGPKAWEFFIFFESGANVSTLSRQILRVSTSENTPPNLRSQTSSLLLPILSAKVRCKNGCFGSQVSLYQDLNVNPDHDSTTTKKQ